MNAYKLADLKDAVKGIDLFVPECMIKLFPRQ